MLAVESNYLQSATGNNSTVSSKASTGSQSSASINKQQIGVMEKSFKDKKTELIRVLKLLFIDHLNMLNNGLR